MLAKYTYKVLENNQIVIFSGLVEIIKNLPKTYRIKLLHFCRQYKPGDEITVSKKKSIQI